MVSVVCQKPEVRIIENLKWKRSKYSISISWFKGDQTLKMFSEGKGHCTSTYYRCLHTDNSQSSLYLWKCAKIYRYLNLHLQRTTLSANSPTQSLESPHRPCLFCSMGVNSGWVWVTAVFLSAATFSFSSPVLRKLPWCDVYPDTQTYQCNFHGGLANFSQARS